MVGRRLRALRRTDELIAGFGPDGGGERKKEEQKNGLALSRTTSVRVDEVCTRGTWLCA